MSWRPRRSIAEPPRQLAVRVDARLAGRASAGGPPRCGPSPPSPPASLPCPSRPRPPRCRMDRTGTSCGLHRPRDAASVFQVSIGIERAVMLGDDAAPGWLIAPDVPHVIASEGPVVSVYVEPPRGDRISAAVAAQRREYGPADSHGARRVRRVAGGADQALGGLAGARWLWPSLGAGEVGRPDEVSRLDRLRRPATSVRARPVGRCGGLRWWNLGTFEVNSRAGEPGQPRGPLPRASALGGRNGVWRMARAGAGGGRRTRCCTRRCAGVGPH